MLTNSPEIPVVNDSQQESTKLVSYTEKRNSSVTVESAGRHAKTHSKYWESRVAHRTYNKDGREVELPEWYILLQFRKRREWFNLGTAIQKTAGEKARDIYVSLIANGWETTIAKFKPKASEAKPKSKLTIKDWFDAVTKSQLIPNLYTLEMYKVGFRTLVGQVIGIPAGKRWSRAKLAERRARIDRIVMSKITPERVQRALNEMVVEAGKLNNPAKLASLKRSLNSKIGRAQALFSPALLKALKDLPLVRPHPVEGLERYDRGSTKYVPKFDTASIIAAAEKELKVSDPEAYKVFLLAIFTGLRRGEIDMLEWSHLDLVTGQINVYETSHLKLKSRSSTRNLLIERELVAELMTMKAASASNFVITPKRVIPFVRSNKTRNYRCQVLMVRLIEWLRGKDITAQKPIHELRKEFGSLVATRAGIYACATVLGHGNITVAVDHYAAQRTTVHAGLGKFLNSDIHVVPDPQAQVA